ncbi:MAG: hypothetical protein DRN90_02075 [Thermoproteota archaeon]|nr:MAG: hypothetical protein DRN90_02075 [Candidatus Korarchaeota archaeon]
MSWKTKVVSPLSRKIRWSEIKAVLFHSDDWGYCGFCPDLEAASKLVNHFRKKYGKKADHLIKATLETPDDLERLFEVLGKYEDRRGKPPVFQAAYVLGNPDYKKIKESGFQKYYDLPIPEVPKRWRRGDFVSKAFEGIEKGVWLPTFHGLSHFDPERWIKDLQNDPDTQAAFMESCYLSRNDPIASCLYAPSDKEAIKRQKEEIKIGVERFQRVFGFKPFSAVAPFYVWHPQVEGMLAEAGIKAIQGKNLQQIRANFWHRTEGKIFNLVGYKHSYKLWQISSGDRNVGYGIYYITRNVYFEPWGRKDDAIVLKTLEQIRQAWEKDEPAVIITHRANYAHLDEEVVETNIKHLDRLLYMLVTQEDKVTFMTDEEIVRLCEG